MRRIIYLFFAASISLFLMAGCADHKTVIDQNTQVPDHNWAYLNKFRYDVNISNENTAYNLYMNLRVTADYKYSNLFVLVTQSGPDKKTVIKRYELHLASRDGEWFGAGSGNFYSYQLPFLTDYKFPVEGKYHFFIEQNMRDNPLREVSDVGLRVELVK